MTAESVYEWWRPPPEGWTADHLDEIPPDAPRMEMIDGALIMMSPHTDFHGTVMWKLASALDEQAPDDVRAIVEMPVKLGVRQRPEPDVVLVRPKLEDPERRRTFYQPDEIVLLIEIVSPESEERDRKTKPLKYAEAGIRHFWLVENENGQPTVHVLELDKATGAYVATAIARERLKVDVPFPIDIDLTTVVRRRPNA